MYRVSTVNLNNMTIGGALKAQTQWAKAEEQQSSGLVSTDFEGLDGSGSSKTLSLEKEIQMAQTWSTEATSTGDRAEAMYSAIGDMTDLMTKLQTQVNTAISSTDNSGLSEQIQALQDSLVGEINTKLNGVYLFAGSNTSTAPADLTNYTVSTGSMLTVPTTTSDLTSYYTGDDTTLSVRISSEQTVNYGVTGDNQAFQEAMAAMQVVKNIADALDAGTITTDTATTYLKSALDTINSATTDLSNLQATVSANASTLSNAATEQTSYVTFLQNSLSSVKDVDAAQVAAQVAAYKTQLTASYSAVSDVSKFSLVQYL